jgi:RNA polymerase sigma factor (sigma-70 family)
MRYESGNGAVCEAGRSVLPEGFLGEVPVDCFFPTGGIQERAARKDNVVDIESIYRQFGPMVLRRCRQMLRDEDGARDAMQDVFVQVLRRETMILEHPSSLLYRIATNTCLNLLRDRKRHPEDRDDDLLARIAAVDDHGAELEARSVLDRLFGREKESTRTIAVLHLLDGFTLDETAKLVGMSVSGVRKRLRLLRGRIRELEGV